MGTNCPHLRALTVQRQDQSADYHTKLQQPRIQDSQDRYPKEHPEGRLGTSHLNILHTNLTSSQFLAINPNGRIPALTDTFSDGKPINLFESGSIMQYLVERYDSDHKISFPKGTREWYEMNNWLFFQNAGVGPMQGQASKFRYDLPLLNMHGCQSATLDVSRHKSKIVKRTWAGEVLELCTPQEAKDG